MCVHEKAYPAFNSFFFIVQFSVNLGHQIKFFVSALRPPMNGEAFCTSNLSLSLSPPFFVQPIHLCHIFLHFFLYDICSLLCNVHVSTRGTFKSVTLS